MNGKLVVAIVISTGIVGFFGGRVMQPALAQSDPAVTPSYEPVIVEGNQLLSDGWSAESFVGLSARVDDPARGGVASRVLSYRIVLTREGWNGHPRFAGAVVIEGSSAEPRELEFLIQPAADKGGATEPFLCRGSIKPRANLTWSEVVEDSDIVIDLRFSGRFPY